MNTELSIVEEHWRLRALIRVPTPSSSPEELVSIYQNMAKNVGWIPYICAEIDKKTPLLAELIINNIARRAENSVELSRILLYLQRLADLGLEVSGYRNSFRKISCYKTPLCHSLL